MLERISDRISPAMIHGILQGSLGLCWLLGVTLAAMLLETHTIKFDGAFMLPVGSESFAKLFSFILIFLLSLWVARETSERISQKFKSIT